jgi:hypothetical protein
MPSQILHVLFGEDVTAALYRRLTGLSGTAESGDAFRFGLLADKAMEKINRDYRGAFALGCQGPDIFYHSQHRRPVALEYGSLLHRRGCGIFTAGLLNMGLPDPPPDEDDIRSHRREKGINALGVYALGFMTHAVLDRFCHPYIVYKSLALDAEGKPLRENRFAHPFFERIIDALMLNELRGREAASWDQEEILAAICAKPPLGLKELLARALAAGFPDKVKRDRKLAQRIDNAFADCARFYRLTAPARTVALARKRPALDARFLAYIFPEQLPAGIDFLNLKHEPWYYPYCPPGSAPEADTRSFPEIYAAAVEAAAAALFPCIARYLDSGIFPIAEAARSIGNGGLSIQDGAGKPVAPDRADPLPLGAVLAQQAALRGIG